MEKTWWRKNKFIIFYYIERYNIMDNFNIELNGILEEYNLDIMLNEFSIFNNNINKDNILNEGIKDIVKTIKDKIVKFFKWLIDKITDFFKKIKEKMQEKIREMENLKFGIKGAPAVKYFSEQYHGEEIKFGKFPLSFKVGSHEERVAGNPATFLRNMQATIMNNSSIGKNGLMRHLLKEFNADQIVKDCATGKGEELVLDNIRRAKTNLLMDTTALLDVADKRLQGSLIERIVDRYTKFILDTEEFGEKYGETREVSTKEPEFITSIYNAAICLETGALGKSIINEQLTKDVEASIKSLQTFRDELIKGFEKSSVNDVDDKGELISGSQNRVVQEITTYITSITKIYFDISVATTRVQLYWVNKARSILGKIIDAYKKQIYK